MKKDLFPTIMEPPILVDDWIIEAETEMMFGATKEVRKFAENRRNRYQIEKMASQIRRLNLTPKD